MLTVKQIETAKPKDSGYRLADSGGLYLFITPAGKKVWRLRYRFDGKEKTLVMGEYPDLSLTEAREKAADAKMMVKSGGDPAEAKQQRKKKETHSDQFGVIFKEVVRTQASSLVRGLCVGAWTYVR